MYKGNSQTLQRRATRIHEVRPDPSVYISDDDLIPTADNMGYRECVSERQQLMLEKVRCEQEMASCRARGAKINGTLAQRYNTLNGRLSLVNKRLKTLNREHSKDALAKAVAELVPEDLREAIYARQKEIVAALQVGGGSQ